MEQQITELIAGYEQLLLQIAASVAVLALAFYLAKLAKPAVRRFDEKVEAIEFSKHTTVIITQAVKYTIYLTAFVVVLTIFGLTEALYTLLTGGAILGFAVGYAAKDVLSNMLSGVIVAVDKPFSIGDDIEVGGIRGEVKVIAFRTTTVVTSDGYCVEIPNADMTSKVIKNYSRHVKKK